jgi:valyl-tRNA synthetase
MICRRIQGLDDMMHERKYRKLKKKKDLILKIEDYIQNFDFRSRGGEAVEPFLKRQWFVKMHRLPKEHCK